MADQQSQVKKQVADSTVAVRKVQPRVKPLTPCDGGGTYQDVYIAYMRPWSAESAADAIAAVRDRLGRDNYVCSYSVCAYAYDESDPVATQEAYHNWQARAYEVDTLHRDLEQETGRTISYTELKKLLPKHLRDVAIEGTGKDKDPAWVALCDNLISGVIHVTKDNPLQVHPEDGVPYKVTIGVNGSTGSLVVKRVDAMPERKRERVTFKSRIHGGEALDSNFLGGENDGS